MFDLVRLGRVLAGASLAPRVSVLDEVRTTFVVGPGDADANRHLNNGRYLQLMDLARFALVVQGGLGGVVLRRRWTPILAGAQLEFLREIPLFASFSIRSRIVSWDTRWFYIEQRFERGGRVVAIGRVQGQFRGEKGRVAPSEVLAELGPVPPAPPLPEAFARAFAGRTPREPFITIIMDDLPGLGSFAA